MRHHEGVWQSDQAASRLARLSSDGIFDRRVIAHRSKRDRYPKRRGGGLYRATEQGDIWPGGGVRVEDDGNPRDSRRDLLEQLQPFFENRRIVGAEPGDVAAGSREVLNNAQSNRIGHQNENDRYRASLLSQCCNWQNGVSENGVRRQADQFCGVGLEESWIANGEAVVDPDILTLDPPQTP